METSVNTRIKGMSPQLIVSNIEQSLDYYTNKLGFKISFRFEEFYAGISKAGFSIHLKSGKPYVADQTIRRENEDIDILFSVEGIDELYEDCSGRQVNIVQPLREMPYGREFYIADPDGYIIAFLESA